MMVMFPAVEKTPFPSGQETENTANRYFPVIPVAYVFGQQRVELAPPQNCSVKPSFDEMKRWYQTKPAGFKLGKNKKKVGKVY
jgi:hypothetical protein